jgi:hypothetical protein
LQNVGFPIGRVGKKFILVNKNSEIAGAIEAINFSVMI